MMSTVFSWKLLPIQTKSIFPNFRTVFWDSSLNLLNARVLTPVGSDRFYSVFRQVLHFAGLLNLEVNIEEVSLRSRSLPA